MAAGSTGVWSLQTGQSCHCLALPEPQVTCWAGGSESKGGAPQHVGPARPLPCAWVFPHLWSCQGCEGLSDSALPPALSHSLESLATSFNTRRNREGSGLPVLPTGVARELGCSARAAAIWPDPSSFLRKDLGLQPRPSGSGAHKPSHPQVLLNHGPLAAWRFCPKGPDVLRSVCELRAAPRSAGWPLLPGARFHLC